VQIFQAKDVNQLRQSVLLPSIATRFPQQFSSPTTLSRIETV